jgi:hypothetical protein
MHIRMQLLKFTKILRVYGCFDTIKMLGKIQRLFFGWG